MRVGIIGCGQLARMMAQAGARLGLEFSFLAEPGESTESIEGLGLIVQRSENLQPSQIYRAMGEPAVITIEKEHVDTELLQAFKAHCAVYPDSHAAHLCQHRVREKRFIADLGLNTAGFTAASTGCEVADAALTLGLPVVVKAATHGYDGKSQWRLNSMADVEAFRSRNGRGEWLVESLIPYDREISVIAARSASNDVVIYPPTENRHRDGVLLTSIAPANGLSPAILEACEEYIEKLLRATNYVGVLTMECFVVGDMLLINELAPRVHNSGHWTQQADLTCQFENHLRAILGWQLGSTTVRGYAGIINILGLETLPESVSHQSAGLSMNWYGKTAMPGRKLGHLGVCGDSLSSVSEHLDTLQGILYGDTETRESTGQSRAL